MEEKDYRAIDEHYGKYNPEEHLAVFKLNTTMCQYYPAFVRAGVSYRVQAEVGQYGKFDIELVWLPQDRDKITLAKGEFEYGADQMRFDDESRNWDYAFPRSSWNCVSLLTRKEYGKNFQFFIKVSPEYHSAFVIDTRNDFVEKYNNGKREMPRDSTNDKFPTNKWRYVLNWGTVDNNLFIFKDKTIIKNGNVLLMEDDQWNKIHEFFCVRYFPKELNQEIKKQKEVIEEQEYQRLVKQEKRT
jgi:hypothetical protein